MVSFLGGRCSTCTACDLGGRIRGVWDRTLESNALTGLPPDEFSCYIRARPDRPEGKFSCLPVSLGAKLRGKTPNLLVFRALWIPGLRSGNYGL